MRALSLVFPLFTTPVLAEELREELYLNNQHYSTVELHKITEINTDTYPPQIPQKIAKVCSYDYLTYECPTPANNTIPEVETHPEKPTDRSGWAVTPEIGNLGIGASVTKSLTPNLNTRIGMTVGSYSEDIQETAVNYATDFSLLSISTLLDYYPFKNSGFRLTGGVLFNHSQINGVAQFNNNQSLEINGREYSASDLGKLDSKISFSQNFSPYVGIGWGNPVKPGKRWGFSVNLGVMFPGSPQVDLIASGINPDLANQIAEDLKAERKRLEDEISKYNLYPVFSVGVSYQF
jgi:hypothetical protein